MKINQLSREVILNNKFKCWRLLVIMDTYLSTQTPVILKNLLSIPSWLTAATNLRCCSTDQTTRGFFFVDGSSLSSPLSSRSLSSSFMSFLSCGQTCGTPKRCWTILWLVTIIIALMFLHPKNILTNLLIFCTFF